MSDLPCTLGQTDDFVPVGPRCVTKAKVKLEQAEADVDDLA